MFFCRAVWFFAPAIDPLIDRRRRLVHGGGRGPFLDHGRSPRWSSRCKLPVAVDHGGSLRFIVLANGFAAEVNLMRLVYYAIEYGVSQCWIAD